MGSFGRPFGRIKKALTPVTRKIRYFLESATKKLTDFAKRTIAYAKAHPSETAVKVVLISGGAALAVVIPALGFAATGPVVGTKAAAWQAAIANVPAGSKSVTMQLFTMAGVLNQVIIMITSRFVYLAFMNRQRERLRKEAI